MDNFGVLVQNYGIKPQGKSSPMSSSKKPHNFNPIPNSKIQSFFNNNDNIDNNDDIFGFNAGKKSEIFDVRKIPTKNNNEVDVNIENMFMDSVSLNPNPIDAVNDDVIWGFNGSTRSSGGGVYNNGGEDLLSSDPVDDFLGSLGNLVLGSGSGREFGDLNDGGGGAGDLLDGFGGSLVLMEDFKKTPSSSFGDDFNSIFGDFSSVGRFEKVEGESDTRQQKRFERYQREAARMVEALENMKEHQYRAQQEQEQKHRIAEAMDMEMKRWVTGKEGNLRALLSSLQLVLEPEFGWHPVNLTDLITSSQVKIAYKRAALLCVHPDKVQQRGASLEQKYVAEKVFHLLQEAWDKFNSEELQ